LVLKVGRDSPVPHRLRANADDEEQFCPVCDGVFRKGRSVRFTPSGKPVHIRCWKKYLAALAVHYNLKASDLVRAYRLTPSTAYRVTRIARAMEAGHGS
jgi:hypothetical protein